MGKREYTGLFLILVVVLSILAVKMSQNKRKLQIQNSRKNMVEIGNQVKQYSEDDTPILPDSLSTQYPQKLQTKIWDFTKKQPNWILLPKPEYHEQTDKGINLRINSSQTVSLRNNKEGWDSDIYKKITVECGPVFEKVEVEITLVNESGAKMVIPEKLTLKEGLVSLQMKREKAFTGKIKELLLRIKNTHSRNMSTFNIKTIQLSN